MEYDPLDKESENLLHELLDISGAEGREIYGAVAENLVVGGYLKAIDVRTLSDSGPRYLVAEITQKGKAYFEMKAYTERERRRLSKREWFIAIVSALIGSLLGLIPTIVQLFQSA